MKTLTSLALKSNSDGLFVLDQRLLPHEERWVACADPEHMVELIQGLAVRGAPLIGIAAALAVAHHARRGANADELRRVSSLLRGARPTAVNLMAAIDRLLALPELSTEAVIREAEAIFDEDVAMCEAMAELGARLIEDGDSILTHCNAGGLVAGGIGTALGVVRRAHEQGKKLHVYVDETRPLLQGARITAWELGKLGIDHTLICDNMAAGLMAQGKIQKIFVGADRIAKNGDVANKIGTYGVAVLAHFHRIPFYVVAPRTTFDRSCASGREIPIEQRAADEVRAGKSPATSRVYNPAFDVTPRELITGIVLDDGVL
ncbi:MAG TPA: S-methyl-5-thioribose-1-phosphate isomerase [Polyangiaceae bacterium]|nr:S-methyl-5-thioribose-1-phosphate isomerase [Polyangiaceae bacterium]